MRKGAEKTIHSIINAADKTIDILLLILFVAVAFFTVYLALQNNTMVNEAGSGQFIAYKPSSDDQLSFDELKRLNPEVIGWLTIFDTPVDYPIVQGRNNSKYVNTSVLGEFSLSGALFLDSRNDASFSDTLSIIYGHNMVGSVMFGDFYMYEDKAYFDSHLTGTVFFGGEYHELEIFALMRADGYDFRLYNVGLSEEELPDWMDRVKSEATHLSDDVPDEGPLLMLSTCAVGDTNGRTVLIARIGDVTEVSLPDAPERKKTAVQRSGEEDGLPPLIIILIVAAVLIPLTVLGIIWKKRRREAEKNGSEH